MRRDAILPAARRIGWALAVGEIATIVLVLMLAYLSVMRSEAHGRRNAADFIAKVQACYRRQPSLGMTWNQCEHRIRDAS